MLYVTNKYIHMLYIYIYYIYIYIYIYIYTIKYRVSTELHFWFDVWVPLAALLVNLLGKYPFFN